MKIPKNRLVPILFALSGVFWLLPVVKQLIKGEPLNESFPIIAFNNFVIAVIFFVVDRRSGGESVAPKALQVTSSGEK